MPVIARPALLSVPRHGSRIRQINLAAALLRSGFMPFLSLFLYERGLGPASIGMVMAFGSAVQLIATVPGGVLVDHPRGRSLWLGVVALLVIAACFCLIWSHDMTGLLCGVGMMSLVEAVVVPAIMVINLESVPSHLLADQIGGCQALGHIGRAVGLVLSGMIGNRFGFAALIGCEGIYLLVFLGLIGRGMPLRRLSARPVKMPMAPGAGLILLGVTLGLFQIGNAVLPVLLGLSLVERSGVSHSILASNIATVAQLAMVAGSLIAAPALRRWGPWSVLAASFVLLPIRCACVALLPASLALWPVELLHGLGEALQMVTIAGFIGGSDHAPGRAGTRFGCVLLLERLGAVIGPLVGGYAAEHWGGPAACTMLGLIGLGSIGIWVASRPYMTKQGVRGQLGLA